MPTIFKNLSKIELALLFVGFVLVLFFSAYKLYESPDTWMDEGLIIQSVQGILETGKAALPVAPGVFEPAWYITTGFPVTLPLAAAFAIFGTSLEVARLVMLVFLIALYVMLWLYARKAIGGLAAWFGFFLLIFFAPIYGDGRNVLGEIPGLLIMVAALWPLVKGGPLTRSRAIWIGIGAGLAFAAKPIFLLFVAALFLSLLLRHKEVGLKKVFFFGVLGALVPLAVWGAIQFDHFSLSRVLEVYSNPHDLSITNALLTNIKRFFTELQPMYFLGALLVWVVSYGMRRWRKEAVPITEEVLLFFSVLIFLAFLRTAGYYRYFFPGQVFALLYLPFSLWYLVGKKSVSFSRGVIVVLCGLVVFGAYQTVFHSWVAEHYNSTRTQTLEQYFASLPKNEELFVYQAPEVMTFGTGHPLYQYVEITPSIRAGEMYKDLVSSGKVQNVLTQTEIFNTNRTTIFAHYTVKETFDSYVVLQHI
jgi:hypothetical protein